MAGMCQALQLAVRIITYSAHEAETGSAAKLVRKSPCLLQAFEGADYLFIVTDGGVVNPKEELQQGKNAADAAEQARPCTWAKASGYCTERQEGHKDRHRCRGGMS